MLRMSPQSIQRILNKIQEVNLCVFCHFVQLCESPPIIQMRCVLPNSLLFRVQSIKHEAHLDNETLFANVQLEGARTGLLDGAMISIIKQPSRECLKQKRRMFEIDCIIFLKALSETRLSYNTKYEKKGPSRVWFFLFIDLKPIYSDLFESIMKWWFGECITTRLRWGLLSYSRGKKNPQNFSLGSTADAHIFQIIWPAV